MADETASPLGVAAGSGWNSAAWGAPPWNDIGIGTVTVVFDSSETVIATNVSATGSVGTVVVGADQIVYVINSWTADTTFVTADSTAYLASSTASSTLSLQAVTALGTVSVSFGAINVPVTGVAAGSSWGAGPWGAGPWNDGGIGTVIVNIINGSNTVIATGVEATGSIGDVVISFVPYTYANPTGVEAVGAIGAVTVVPNTVIILTGVSATGEIGTVLTTANSQWFTVNDNQTPNWVPVDDSQIN